MSGGFLSAVAALLLGVAPAALAAGVDESQLFQDIPSVYGASKHDQKLTDAPASVSIVSADEIARYGYRTLADLLRTIPGFYVSYDRNYSYIGARGFGRAGDYNSRVLVLIDGMRFNDNVYDGALIGNEFILDMELIDRVEIIRGPSSSLYGTSAVFGVVNVITKRGRDYRGTQAAASTGSFNSDKLRVTGGDKVSDDLELLVSGSAYVSHGHDVLRYPGLGSAHDADRENAQRLYARANSGDFNLQAGFVARTKQIPTGVYDTVLDDPRNQTRDASWFVDWRLTHELSRDSELTARLSYSAYEFEGRYAIDFPPVSIGTDQVHGEWWGGELKWTGRLPGRHRVTAGTEYQRNVKQDQWYQDVSFLLDDRRESFRWAAYLQDDYRISNHIIINAGVRHDHYSTFGGTTNPRVAVIYKPQDQTAFKLLYGQAFRAPNAYELYYGGAGLLANPDLRPEVTRTYELAYERFLESRYRLSASLFHYSIEDLISQQSEPGGLIFRNVNSVSTTGTELGIERRWSDGRELRLSYGYQNATDGDTGAWLVNSPRHMIKLNLSTPLRGERLVLSGDLQYLSKRLTNAGDVNGFVVVNSNLVWRQPMPGMTLSFGVYNLLDRAYADPASDEHTQDAIPQDGRTWRFKLSYEF